MTADVKKLIREIDVALHDICDAPTKERARELADEAHGKLHDVAYAVAFNAPPTSGEATFEWLCRKYVQRSDARQAAMGLQYMEAETHDLAKEIDRRFAAPPAPNREGEAERLLRKITAGWAAGPDQSFADGMNEAVAFLSASQGPAMSDTEAVKLPTLSTADLRECEAIYECWEHGGERHGVLVDSVEDAVALGMRLGIAQSPAVDATDHGVQDTAAPCGYVDPNDLRSTTKTECVLSCMEQEGFVPVYASPPASDAALEQAAQLCEEMSHAHRFDIAAAIRALKHPTATDETREGT